MADNIFDNVPPPRRKAPGRRKKADGSPLLTEAQLKEERRKLLNKNQSKRMKAEHLLNRIKKEQKALTSVEGVIKDGEGLVADDVLSELPVGIQDAIKNKNVIFQANPGPQSNFLAATEDEVFYGGARGGGKSFALIVDPLRYCSNPNFSGLLIRRTMPELRDLINHSMRLYPQAYPGAKWREQEKEWRFPSGARMEFGYAETLEDALRYQGRQYQWIGIDELPQYPTDQILTELRGSLRTVDPSLPTVIRATGNPGNIGSPWVKSTFIDPAPWNHPFALMIDTPLGVKKLTRRFIPAKVFDNPYLTRDDRYITMLSQLPEHKRKQWLEGNWDIIESAAFPEFNRDIHICEPFNIPSDWLRFRSADWGYRNPGCVLWFAMSPEGILYVYREWYFKEVPADRWAEQVQERQNGERMQYSVIDGSIWAKRGETGPTVGEMINSKGGRWRAADRSPGSRKAGKMEVHRRLQVEDFGQPLGQKPLLQIFRNCQNLIRTLPSLPVDENNVEDVDTDTEDHAYDALRYGCMSRPILPHDAMLFSTSTTSRSHGPADPTFGY